MSRNWIKTPFEHWLELFDETKFHHRNLLEDTNENENRRKSLYVHFYKVKAVIKLYNEDWNIVNIVKFYV